MSISAITSPINAIFTQKTEQINSNNLSATSNDPAFITEFKAALATINQLQVTAQHKTHAFQQGDPTTSLNEVMIDLQKSSVALQFGIQVRNKLVNAYQEVMNIAV